jgi:hypothetical protein
MSTMQAFYTNLFSQNTQDNLLEGLLQIARSSLSDVLAVRSELAWEIWD